MDEPIATIVSISNGLAIALVERNAVCARCAAGKGCGAGLLQDKRMPARVEVAAPGSMQLRVGDQVTLSLDPQDLLSAALLAYGLPLAGVVSALSIGGLLANGPLGDATALGLAIAGLLAGLAMGRYRISRNRCLDRLVLKISARLPGVAA